MVLPTPQLPRKMRRIIFEASVSLDGFIEGPSGELDWIGPSDERGSYIEAKKFLSSFDTIFFGRKAYEKIGLIHPDTNLSESDREFCYMMHGMRKYVFSRTAKHVPGNAMVISRDVKEEVTRIREEDGKNIWFCGGADILKTFSALDLIDEYVLAVQPVLLKSGRPLFPGSKWPLDLTLVDRQNLDSGVVILHYRPESRLNISYI